MRTPFNKGSFMQQARLLGLGVASAVHGREYYEHLWEEFRGVLHSLGVETLGVITSREDVERVSPRLREADALFIAVLTGGSSGIVRSIAGVVGKKPLVLLAHGYHNSFASALSAKSRLEVEGHRVYLVEAERPSEMVEEAAVAVRAVRAIVELSKAKVVELNAREVRGEALQAASIFGFRVETIPPEELDKLLDSVDTQEVARYVRQHFDLGGVDEALLEGPMKLAAAAMRVVRERGASAVTIDCFPFIVSKKFTPCLMMAYLLDEGIVAACEADYRALVLLYLAKMLTGKPGWIANPSHYNPSDNTLILAHCTAATSLGSYASLLPHFETGRPYAVHVRLEPGVYTMTALSPDMKTLAFGLVEVLESGMFTGGRCRSQALVKFVEEEDPAPFPEKAVSNHHILIRGDVRRELSIAARLLGLRPKHY